MCNIVGNEEEESNNKKNENEKKNKLTESKQIRNQLNFFSDSVTKGISHRRNDKSIFTKNHDNLMEKKDEDEDKKTDSDFDKEDNGNVNILSKELTDEMKKKGENNNDNERNISEESDELKDSFCDNILKNIDKYRGETLKED